MACSSLRLVPSPQPLDPGAADHAWALVMGAFREAFTIPGLSDRDLHWLRRCYDVAGLCGGRQSLAQVSTGASLDL